MGHHGHPGSGEICVLSFHDTALPKYGVGTFRRVRQQGSGMGNSIWLLHVQTRNKINLLAWNP